MKIKSLKTGIKLFFVVAMACFFFPFVTVSCSGGSTEATGFELATNISMHEDIEFGDDDRPNPYLVVGLACGLVGLGVAWGINQYNKKALASGVLAVAGIISLCLFRFTFWNFYELTGYESRVNVEFRWGWIVSLVAYMGAAGLSFLSYFRITSYNQAQSFPAQKPEPTIGKYDNGGDVRDPVSEHPAGEAEPENVNTQTLDDIYPLNVVIRGRFETGEIQEWRPIEFPCFIGRDSSVAQIVVSDSCTSKVHARLYIESGSLMISDEESSNGTIVNNEKILAPVELLSGDQVTIGKSVLCFEVAEGKSYL